MDQCSEGNIATQINQQWYSVYEEHFWYHKYVFMQIGEFLGVFLNVPCHVDWFIPTDILF